MKADVERAQTAGFYLACKALWVKNRSISKHLSNF